MEIAAAGIACKDRPVYDNAPGLIGPDRPAGSLRCMVAGDRTVDDRDRRAVCENRTCTPIGCFRERFVAVDGAVCNIYGRCSVICNGTAAVVFAVSRIVDQCGIVDRDRMPGINRPAVIAGIGICDHYIIQRQRRFCIDRTAIDGAVMHIGCKTRCAAAEDHIAQFQGRCRFEQTVITCCERVIFQIFCISYRCLDGDHSLIGAVVLKCTVNGNALADRDLALCQNQDLAFGFPIHIRTEGDGAAFVNAVGILNRFAQTGHTVVGIDQIFCGRDHQRSQFFCRHGTGSIFSGSGDAVVAELVGSVNRGSIAQTEVGCFCIELDLYRAVGHIHPAAVAEVIMRTVQITHQRTACRRRAVLVDGGDTVFINDIAFFILHKECGKLICGQHGGVDCRQRAVGGVVECFAIDGVIDLRRLAVEIRTAVCRSSCVARNDTVEQHHCTVCRIDRTAVFRSISRDRGVDDPDDRAVAAGGTDRAAVAARGVAGNGRIDDRDAGIRFDRRSVTGMIVGKQSIHDRDMGIVGGDGRSIVAGQRGSIHDQCAVFIADTGTEVAGVVAHYRIRKRQFAVVGVLNTAASVADRVINHRIRDRQISGIEDRSAVTRSCRERNIHVVHGDHRRIRGNQHRTAVTAGKRAAAESHVAHFHRAAGDLKESVIGNSISGIAVDHTESCIQFLCCETCRIAAALCCRVDIQCRFQRVFHLNGHIARFTQRAINGNIAVDDNGTVQRNSRSGSCPINIRAESDRVVVLKGLRVSDSFPQAGHTVVGIDQIFCGRDHQRSQFFCRHGTGSIFSGFRHTAVACLIRSINRAIDRFRLQPECCGIRGIIIVCQCAICHTGLYPDIAIEAIIRTIEFPHQSPGICSGTVAIDRQMSFAVKRIGAEYRICRGIGHIRSVCINGTGGRNCNI